MRFLYTSQRFVRSGLKSISLQKKYIFDFPLVDQHRWYWPTKFFPPPSEWGYKQNNGPSTWGTKYLQAKGSNQSPIDFQIAQIHCAPELQKNPLSWNYSTQICERITNSGSGWRGDFLPGEDLGLSGGPLEHNYELIQFHCHWGRNTQHGSEHTVDGKPYVGELHFVHWNKDCYEKCVDAVSQPKGLAVVGVFLEVGEENAHISSLCDAIQKIPFRDQSSTELQQFDITALYPDDHSYWTYDGSLTTPPCYESVIWIVFKKPITVSEKQLECFRQMHIDIQDEADVSNICCSKVKRNFRPPQALNQRIVRECSYS